jgi:outer membrane protein, heavy metal efflux system
MRHLFNSQSLKFIVRSCIISLLCMPMQGCVKYNYKAKPINTSNVLDEINSWSVHDSGLNRFLQLNGMSIEQLNSNIFSIERLYLTSLYYDPEMQVAYKEWKKAQIIAKHSNYKIRPEIAVPFEHHSDTSGGQSEWTIGVVLNFIYERKGKREARQARANIELLNAKLAINKLALQRYGMLERKYHAFIIMQTKVTEIKNEINVLKELLEQLEKKYELGGVSQFEISTIKLELQQRLFQSSLQENMLQEIKDDLLTMTNLPYSEYGSIEFETISPLIFTKKLYQDTALIEVNITGLQTRMLNNHIELAMQLNNYAQTESELRLEIEKQYPDLVLSPGFIFDQSDNIWALGTSWILPLFKNTKQNLRILKALEDRKIKQQEIVVLQKNLLNSLYMKHNSILRHKNTLQVSDEIVAAIEQRANEIKSQIEAGGIDRIVMLRNRMELYKAKQSQVRIYDEAINAMLEIENQLQVSHANIEIGHVVESWLIYIEEKNNNESIN